MAFSSQENLQRALQEKARRLPFTRRDAWRLRRLDMEKRKVKSHPRQLRKRRWDLLGLLLRLGDVFLRYTGLLQLARRTALSVGLVQREVFFANLPEAFDGMKILHVTDPHFDMLPEIGGKILGALPAGEIDLAVFTGDYREGTQGEHRQILPPLRALLGAIRAKEGVYGTLGNHDGADMVPDLEKLGMRVLINESVEIRRGTDTLTLTGLDDVHYYYTEQAAEALRASGPGFKIALVHSNEFSDEVASHGYSLYLCGHTHGGQVCLPGGLPILTHTDAPRRLARGPWQVGELQGYTSRGAGVVGLPLRTFCRGEVTLFVLRREEKVVV